MKELMPSPRHMESWLKAKENVLLMGLHGVGKTALITSAFNKEYGELGRDWLYFSGPTMDPWCDFAGVPREATDDKGNKYLEFVLPKALADGTVKAIFIDEYNRSHKRVRNAVMELSQFKRLNGHVFPNLEVIWVAINPDDEDGTYDVDGIDPAQFDRFHVQIQLPYRPDKAFFTSTFDKYIADVAIDWWKALTDNAKKLVSPRRLEYALRHHAHELDIEEVLPTDCNPKALKIALSETPVRVKMNEIAKAGDIERGTLFVADENNFALCKADIIKNRNLLGFFVPIMPKEKISLLVADSSSVRQFCLSKLRDNSCKKIVDVLMAIKEANVNQTLVREINRAINEARQTASNKMATNAKKNSEAIEAFVGANPSVEQLMNVLVNTENEKNIGQPVYRMKAFNRISAAMPRPHTLEPEQAVRVLDCLEKFVIGRFHTGRVDSLPNVMGVVNNLFASLTSEELGEANRRWTKIMKWATTRDDFYLI